MQVCSSIDVFDAKVAEEIERSDSNQQTIMQMANFHLAKGFVFKQHGNVHLHAACRSKKHQVVQFLVKKGADINFQNRAGKSVLHVVIEQAANHSLAGALKTCKLFDLLVKLGASPSLTDTRRNTVLHQWAFDVRFLYATAAYHRAILACLLAHGVPLGTADGFGNTALMHAAAHRSVRFMMLLEAMATHPSTNLDHKNIYGQTCAHLLVSQSENTKINYYGVDDAQYAHGLKKLIFYGISLWIADRTGESVIQAIVLKRGNNDALRLVLYDHTHDCMLAFLMGTHSRLGETSAVKVLDDIAMELVLTDTQTLLDSIASNSINGTDTVQFQNSLAPVPGDNF